MRRAALIAMLLVCGAWDVLRAPDEDVVAGNRAFAEGKYAEALERYRAAEERGSDPRLSFDTGAALYKLGEQATDPAQKADLFQKSEEAFSRAAESDDPALKSSAYFNLGNAQYQRQRWDEAISAYKRALRASPTNEAARHNLEMALRQRKKQEPPPQQGQQGQQQGQQGQQQGQQGQQQGQQGQQQGQQGQQGQQPDQQDQQGQQGQQGQQQGQQGQQQGQQGQPDQQGQQGQQGQPDQQGQQGQPDPQKKPGDGGKKPEPPDGAGEQDGQDAQRPGSPDGDARGGGQTGEDAQPSDQDRKLDELERRSRDLRKRLLRQGGRNRDPLRLPSRKDW